MTVSPRCAVGLLTWNGEKDIAACVQSLKAQTEPIDICWIDNASQDETIAVAQESWPHLPDPIRPQTNIGFCAGHNLGFNKTTAPYYLALNQDAALEPAYVKRLCDWMDEDPRLALSSGLILWPRDDNGVDRIYSAGVAMGRGHFPFELKRNLPVPNKPARRYLVPAVTGAALMIRRSFVEDILKSDALFPPEFFAYFEEIDLARRAAAAGFRCGVEESARATHAERGEGGRRDRAIRAHYIKNHWLMTLSHGTIGTLIKQIPYLAKGELKHYLPLYLGSPLAFMAAKIKAIPLVAQSRARARRELTDFPESSARLKQFYADSTRYLRG